MECYRKYENFENPKDFIPALNRKTLSENIIDCGKKTLETNLRQYARNYCSLEVDGYSKRSKKIKAFIISFPQFGGRTEVIKLKEMNSSKESFSEVAADVLDYCDSLKLQVCTINTDGYSFHYNLIIINF
jgi:hypothetical protein